MGNDNIKISGVKGDVIGGKVSGTGNIVGKNIRVAGSINIAAGQLEKVPDEYARSLQAFTEAVNQLLQKYRVPADQVAPVQEGVRELAKELETVKPQEKVGYVKQTSIKAKLAAVAESLLGVLPKAAETATAFTPLAPFSKLIGEGVEQVVKAVQKGA